MYVRTYVRMYVSHADAVSTSMLPQVGFEPCYVSVLRMYVRTYIHLHGSLYLICPLSFRCVAQLGRTSLMAAAQEDRLEAIKILVLEGHCSKDVQDQVCIRLLCTNHTSG